MAASALHGRSAVVTGCTRGFGRVLAGMLVDRGVRLVVSGPWPQESLAVADELRSRGGEVVVAPGDVTDAGQVEGLAQVAVDTFGSLDLWVNNAAAATPVGLAFDLSPETFQRSIDVNVRGTYLGARAAAGRMLPARRGVIVNMLGRGDDVRPTPHTSPYGASKAWVRAFTRTLQAEYQDSGVHVVGFNPGMMLTDMLLAPQVVGEPGAAAMKPYATITRIFADPPEVAASRLVEALARATPPKSVRLLGPTGAAKHALRAAARGVTRRGADAPVPVPERVEG